jgi:hypothetical protein
MNNIALAGKPAVLTPAIPGLLRRLFDELRAAEQRWVTAHKELRTRRYPLQRNPVLEQGVMAREMYRL